MAPPRRPRLERSPTRQPAPSFAGRRHILARPATAAELAAQLRELLPHESQCRWATHTVRRPGQTLAQTEAAICTCTAIPDRTHVVDLLRAAAAGQLPAEVLTSTPTGPLGGLRS